MYFHNELQMVCVSRGSLGRTDSMYVYACINICPRCFMRRHVCKNSRTRSTFSHTRTHFIFWHIKAKTEWRVGTAACPLNISASPGSFWNTSPSLFCKYSCSVRSSLRPQRRENKPRVRSQLAVLNNG